MRSPFSPLEFLLFLFALILLMVFVQVGAITIVFDKLGLSQASAILLLMGSLFGSAINIPLFTIDAQPAPETEWQRNLRSILRMPVIPFTGKTIVAVNAGGCLVPLFFSLYLISINPLPLMQVALAVGLVTIISRVASRPVAGIGIGMPILVAPLAAALTALMINAEQSAPLAYIAGTMGVLLGADLLRLGDIRKLGAPFASIGGAGTFDGIFITGVVAVLLA